MFSVATQQGDFIFRGSAVETVRELVEFIRGRREAFPVDEFWVSGEDAYPCMALLTNGAYANVNYFLNETGDMWLSVGDLEKEVTFLAAGVEWPAPADTVIPFETGIRCVEEFCHTLSRPTCIEWQEL